MIRSKTEPKFEVYGVYDSYTGELLTTHPNRRLAEARILPGEWYKRVRGVR